MAHMRRILQGNPLHLRYGPKPRLDTCVRHFIVFAIQEQSFNFDLVSKLPAFPVLEGACDNELGGTLPIDDVKTDPVRIARVLTLSSMLSYPS